MKNKMIFSLDIGSSKITAMVGVIGGENIEIHGVSSYYFANNGRVNDFLNVTNGVVCNIELVSARVAQVLNEARISADCSLGGVIVNIAGSSIRNFYSSSSLDLNNQSVTVDIIQQLIIDARNSAIIPQNYEILDYEVQEYFIDDENFAINPNHLVVNKISSNLNIFLGSNTQLANLRKIFNYSGFSLAKIVPSGILSGMAILHDEEKQSGCCLVDIGAGTTDVVVYENGFIRYLCSLPVGGEHITRDIATVLKISRNLAEDIKLSYGACVYTNLNIYNKVKDNEMITITDHRGSNVVVSQKLLIEVINERVKDIFDMVKTALEKQKIYDIINSGIILTGGVSLTTNIEEIASQYFEVPVRIGLPKYNGNFSEIITTPKYSTNIGALYFAKQYMLDEFSWSSLVAQGPGFSIVQKIKKIFFR